MKSVSRPAIVVAALLVALLPAVPGAQGPPSYSAVTDSRLLNPEPRNWLMYRGNYHGWGYSPLDRITPANVERLAPVWSLSTGVTEGHQSPPIVNDGVMFITTPQQQVIALNARTGEILWRYRKDLPEDLLQLHPTNRGVGLYEDKVYVGTVDAHLIALDAKTGQVVWDKTVDDWKKGYYITLAPLIARGKVMVGTSGGELGVRGFIAAFDAGTGQEVWRTYTIPGPGEPGRDTWTGDAWKTGGVSVWITGHYDPQLGLTYWGTGNAAPWPGDLHPGDNLYSSSVLALDADTGKIRGHHQYHWNDSWDWDEVSTPLLVDVQRGGRTVKGLVHPGRNGYLWLLERRADGIGFVDARPFVTGVPSSYEIDGVQYVAVQSGWGVDAQRMQGRLDTFLGRKTDVPQGGVLWVFALRD